MVPRLSELLGTEVKKADDCIGPEVEKLVGEMQNGQVQMFTQSISHSPLLL